MAKSAETKEELALLVDRMTKVFKDGTMKSRLEKATEDKGMMFAPQLLTETERIQVSMLGEWGYAGEETLKQLHNAIKKAPELRPAIMQLCEAEESMLDGVQAALAERNGIQLPAHSHGEHGHSHNGQPCQGDHGHGNHGHSHNGQPCHADHGHGSHGHSHNGQPCHGHGQQQGPPGSMIAQNIVMSMAQKGVPADQLQFMQLLQRNAMMGKMPTGEEQLRAAQIQQTVMKKVQNLSQIVPKAIEALPDDERAKLISIEECMISGRHPTPEDISALESIQSSISSYCATMGPLLARQLQQQQQAQVREAPVAQKEAGAPAGTESKKRD